MCVCVWRNKLAKQGAVHRKSYSRLQLDCGLHTHTHTHSCSYCFHLCSGMACSFIWVPGETVPRNVITHHLLFTYLPHTHTRTQARRHTHSFLFTSLPHTHTCAHTETQCSLRVSLPLYNSVSGLLWCTYQTQRLLFI